MNSLGAHQALGWNCYGCEPHVPPQRFAKGPSRRHGNSRHTDLHAPGKGVVPEEPVLVQSGCQIGRRVIAAPFADSVDNSFDRMGAAQHLAATGVELPAPMPVGRWKSSRMPARYTEGQAAARWAGITRAGTGITQGKRGAATVKPADRGKKRGSAGKGAS